MNIPATSNVYSSREPVAFEVDEPPETPLLLQFWRAILAQKFAVLIILAASLIVGVLATVIATPYFTASARIQISREDDQVSNIETVQSTAVGESEEFYLTQYAILHSRSLANRVVSSLDLVSSDEFFDLYNVSLESEADTVGGKASNLSTSNRQKREKLATAVLLDHVEILPVAGSSLVDIHFESPDSRLAARVANAWTAEFVKSNLDRRYASTEAARAFLTDRLRQLRERMEESERRLVQYADSQQIVQLGTAKDAEGNAGTDSTLVSADLRSLNEQLGQATAARIAAQANVRASSGQSSTNSTLAGLRQTRAEVASQYAKLLTQFEPGYPAAQALQSQIDALDRSISTEEGRTKSEFSTVYNAALDREQALRAQLEAMKGRFSDERTNSIQLNIYQREVDTNRALYDGLLQRFKEIGVAGVGSNNISVVDAAEAPEFPSSPNLPLNLALALIAGLGLCVSYIFVREHTSQTIRDPSDVSRLFHLPALGSVPYAADFETNGGVSDRLSATWEAYLSVKTSLSMLQESGLPTSFLFTSTQPNEGKSTSCVIIAKILASSGKRVLLIDADMRHPSLHKMLDMRNNIGLSNFLSGGYEFEKLVHDSNVPNLLIMTAGPTPPNAAQLLSGDRISELIALGKNRFDHVIVDSPPVLGLADALLLGHATSGVIYIVSANEAKVPQIDTALRRLRSGGVHIFGAIATKIDPKMGNASYDYYSYGVDEDD